MNLNHDIQERRIGDGAFNVGLGTAAIAVSAGPAGTAAGTPMGGASAAILGGMLLLSAAVATIGAVRIVRAIRAF